MVRLVSSWSKSCPIVPRPLSTILRFKSGNLWRNPKGEVSFGRPGRWTRGSHWSHGFAQELGICFASKDRNRRLLVGAVIGMQWSGTCCGILKIKKIMNLIVEGGNLNMLSTKVCWMCIFEFATFICSRCHKVTVVFSLSHNSRKNNHQSCPTGSIGKYYWSIDN